MRQRTARSAENETDSKSIDTTLFISGAVTGGGDGDDPPPPRAGKCGHLFEVELTQSENLSWMFVDHIA